MRLLGGTLGLAAALEGELGAHLTHALRVGSFATTTTSENGQTPAPCRAILADMLEPDRCYRALKSRDARFDGRFFFGVQTTGIYCRPVCPARTPKRANVRFYACAAAAEQAGFRPCRRCRPETAPGTPAWQGTSATVARALRLIDAGALDRASVGDLAARVGLGERQLRRLFLRHLGASPVAVGQTRRVLTPSGRSTRTHWRSIPPLSTDSPRPWATAARRPSSGSGAGGPSIAR